MRYESPDGMKTTSGPEAGRALVRAGFVLALIGAGGCEVRDLDEEGPAGDEAVVIALWDVEARPGEADLERARRDTTWRRAPSIDTVLRTDPLLPMPEDTLPYRPPPLVWEDSAETLEDLADLPRGDTTAAVEEGEREPAGEAEPGAGGEAEPGVARPGRAGRPIPFDPRREVTLPLGGDAEGPSVMYVQILLDRSRFAPGAIDGTWGKNTEQAVLWFQRAHEIAPTGQMDSTTLWRLYETTGRPGWLRVERMLTESDLAGDYRAIPADVYAQDDLDCLCYESALEELAERAHSTPELLAALNPGVDLEALEAGDRIVLPATGEFAPGRRFGLVVERDRPRLRRDSAAGSPGPDAPSRSTGTSPGAPSAGAPDPEIAELVISDAGRYLHALDAAGNILYHFPATLGSRYAPSPREVLEITGIQRDPWFHWQPELLAGVDDSDPPTRLPPGPNSPVGVVWIGLSREHYGIHGTAAPATIGHVHSSGCVRLTNWDAAFLAERVRPGLGVRFIDVGD